MMQAADAGICAPNLGSFCAEDVWEDAQRILEEVGIEILSEAAATRVRGTLAVKDGRAHFPREVLDHYFEELRSKFRQVPPEPYPFLTLEVSSWHNCFRDPRTGETRPWTTPALKAHAKALRQVGRTDDRLYVHTPGYPQDVSPELAPLEAQYLEFLYSQKPELKMVQGVAAHRHRIEMARIMGLHHQFAAQTPSPLKFGGHTVDIVLELFEPGMSVLIDTMPCVGISAPGDWRAAWALDVAENVGAYIIFRLCGIPDVWTQFRLFAPNMQTSLVYFTSPKALSALMMRSKVRQFFGLKETRRSELNLVVSKAPDQQAAAEKMAGCMMGAIWGFDVIEGAGALYLDEVFSWEQFWIDLEIRDYVASMLQPVAPRTIADTVEAVREGVEGGTFLDTDATLSSYQDFTWHPRRFDIGTRQGWSGHALLEPCRLPDLDDLARAYDYELRDERREALERVMAAAREELG
ncbi:MAG TPA: trimethylamine methyltransferase family protein [Fimbriimonas sp.]